MIYNENGEIVLSENKITRKTDIILKDIQSCIKDMKELDTTDIELFNSSMRLKSLSKILIAISNIMTALLWVDIGSLIFLKRFVFTFFENTIICLTSIITRIISVKNYNNNLEDLLKQINNISDKLEKIANNEELPEDIRKSAQENLNKLNLKIKQLNNLYNL